MDAGTWRGIITGQDADGLPEVDALCTACHRDELVPDMFTPWRESGHATAFSRHQVQVAIDVDPFFMM